MKSGLLLILALLGSFFIYGQENYNNFHSRNAFYLELGGAAVSGSINYERRFIQSEYFRYGFRLGYGFHFGGLGRGPEEGGSAVPIMGMASYGNLAHQVEFGLGTTLLMDQGFKTTGNTQYPTIEGKIRMVGVTQLGYRFHPHTTGVVFRVTFSPMLYYLNGGPARFEPWAGLSIGWALPNSKVK